MRILIDLTALADNFSGIERYAANISYELIMQAGQDEFVLLFKEKIHPIFEELALHKNVEVIILPRCNKLLFNQVRLPWAIHRCRADWYLFLAFPVPVLTFKKNMISTLHDICCWDCPETMNGLSKWYFRISHQVAMKKCRYMITISEFSKKRIIDRLGYPQNKLLLIYCGIEDKFCNISADEKTKWVAEKYQLPEHYILSLSTLEPRKNLSLLINAYQKLVLESDIEIPLVLAGRKGWKLNTLLEGIDEGVCQQIIFTGFIDDEDLPYVYRNADFFVFPSKYEGFGIPPLEAMACGTPVLSSDAASMPEVLGDGCKYFQSGDERELKEQIKYMLELSEENRQDMINRGFEQTKLFSWKQEAVKLSSILNEQGKR